MVGGWERLLGPRSRVAACSCRIVVFRPNPNKGAPSACPVQGVLIVQLEHQRLHHGGGGALCSA